MTTSLTVEQRDEALNRWAAGSCTATGTDKREAEAAALLLTRMLNGRLASVEWPWIVVEETAGEVFCRVDVDALAEAPDYFSHTERLTLAVVSCRLGCPVPVSRSLWERLDRGNEALFTRALDLASWKLELA